MDVTSAVDWALSHFCPAVIVQFAFLAPHVILRRKAQKHRVIATDCNPEDRDRHLARHLLGLQRSVVVGEALLLLHLCFLDGDEDKVAVEEEVGGGWEPERLRGRLVRDLLHINNQG